MGRVGRAAFAVAMTVGLTAAAAMSLAPSASADEAKPVAMVLVLDASGSMNEPDGHGSTKIKAAKAALKTIVGQLPADQQVGLRVYGHSVPSKPDHVKACQNTELIAPVTTLDRPGLTAAIDQFTALGETPIGLSLQKAAADLPKGVQGSIVLVSDGEDSCAPPAPCDVAKQMKASGVQLTVNTVGLKVNATAKSELGCIAQATGGTYTDVQDSAKLAESLTTVAVRNRRSQNGTQVEGATSTGDAPKLQAGEYTDSIVMNETLYYRVDLAEGQKAVARVTYDGGKVETGIPEATVQWKSDEVDSIDKKYQNDFDGKSVTFSTTAGPVAAAADPSGASSSDSLAPGAYFLELTLSSIASEPSKEELPIAIDLSVTGADGAALPAGSPGEASSEAGAGSGEASGSAQSSPQASIDTAAASSSGGGTSILLLAGVGAGGLVVGFLAGLLFMLTRRRGAGHTQPPSAYGTPYAGGGHDARPPSYYGN